MEYFLEKIAASSYKRFGNNLNRHCFVFPNRRAGIFFLKYLSSNIERPIFEPAVLTINDLFRSCSNLQLADHEALLFNLYKVYTKLMKLPESFDSFFYWGDILLNDFDDIDKYLVNSQLLYKNISDIKAIDKQFGCLTESQIEIIKQFWINFNPENETSQKKDFLGLWNTLEKTYTEFKTLLKNKNIAYEGMIFRDAAENCNPDLIIGNRWDTIHFIGFNALNECEKKLMLRLKKSGKANFYWDYDKSYITGAGYNSAGYFLKDNIALFGNDMPEDWSYTTLLSDHSKQVKRRIIDASSDVAQVKTATSMLVELAGNIPEKAHETAMVLADENLLIPVLSSLPENIGDVNITMGYPLKHTKAYIFLKNVMDLQRNAEITNNVVYFQYTDVINILKNRLVLNVCNSANSAINEIEKNNIVFIPETFFANHDKLNIIFSRPKEVTQYSSYFINILSVISSGCLNNDKELPENNNTKLLNEQLYRIALVINKLDAVIRDGEISFSHATYMRLLDRILNLQTIPFSGEPLSGIQIMGILETRALDFKNLIILSVNDGVLPSVSSPASSYIPFSLREAFGLPSVNHQESIYAYHFFRLLHRAENITFIYNSNSEGLRSGEISRFLIQMNFNPELKPETLVLCPEIKSFSAISDIVERTDKHHEKLMSLYTGESKTAISPSAINMWLNCRMKFYYKYICSLTEPDKIKTEIDPAALGLMLHDVMKSLYQNFKGKSIEKSFLENLISREQPIRAEIEKSVRNKSGIGSFGASADGAVLIVKEVLLKYIINILKADISYLPIKILGIEENVSFPTSVDSGNERFNVSIGGIADRIDIVENTVRIVDYKTGTASQSITSISELFDDDRKKDHDGWLQTLLYCESLFGKTEGLRIKPSIYKIRTIGAHNDTLLVKSGKTTIEVDDYSQVRDEFIAGLNSVVNLIFDKNEHFRMTRKPEMKCKYCAYRDLCAR